MGKSSGLTLISQINTKYIPFLSDTRPAAPAAARAGRRGSSYGPTRQCWYKYNLLTFIIKTVQLIVVLNFNSFKTDPAPFRVVRPLPLPRPQRLHRHSVDLLLPLLSLPPPLRPLGGEGGADAKDRGGAGGEEDWGGGRDVSFVNWIKRSEC